MNELEIFNFEGSNVRTLNIEGEAWFVGKDVATILGYKNPQRAIRNHVETEDKGVTQMVTPGGKQELSIINEAGLYCLILASKLPEAKRFKSWVTKEVIPSILKRGIYATQTTIERILNDPEFGIKLLTELKEEREKNARLQQLADSQREEIDDLRPKGEYYDELVDINLLTNIRTTSNELDIPQNKMVRWLLEKKFLYRDANGVLKAYSKHLRAGLFAEKEYVRNGHAGTQTHVTTKGREKILRLWKKDHANQNEDDFKQELLTLSFN